MAIGKRMMVVGARIVYTIQVKDFLAPVRAKTGQATTMKHLLFIATIGVLLSSFGSSSTLAQTDSTFKPSGKFSSLVFGDYSYKIHADSLNRGVGQYSGLAKAFSNFQLRRFYLGYNYDISTTFAAEVLIAYEDGGGGSATVDPANERAFYLKLANIRWKRIFANSDLVFGAQLTPAFARLSEQVWGYRSIEKTLLDKNRIAGATDLGIGLQGSFDDGQNFGYDLLYANGSAQKLEVDKFKKLYGDVWLWLMDKKILLSVYGDLNRTSDMPSKDISTMKFFVAYRTTPVTIGVEGFLQSQTHNVIDSNLVTGVHDTASLHPLGISVFVNGPIVENTLHFFARFDMFNPDNNYQTSEGIQYPKGYNATNEYFVVAGFDWTPSANIHIMPNLWYTDYSSKLPVTSNVTGAAAPVGSLSQLDYDLAARVTVYYKF